MSNCMLQNYAARAVSQQNLFTQESMQLDVPYAILLSAKSIVRNALLCITAATLIALIFRPSIATNAASITLSQMNAIYLLFVVAKVVDSASFGGAEGATTTTGVGGGGGGAEGATTTVGEAGVSHHEEERVS